MSKPGPVFAWGSVSEDLALFKALTPEQRFKTFDAMVRQDLVRGEMLVAQGDPADSLYIVLHGALAVRRTGDSLPIAELRAGELVGEIGFFANLTRTANVIAIRDTSVLVLTRTAYRSLAEGTPAIAEALLAALANNPHLANGAHRGADRWRSRADSGYFLPAHAREPRQDRRPDRRSRPRRLNVSRPGAR
jgi:NTE family protein